jgi:hypothetical protein
MAFYVAPSVNVIEKDLSGIVRGVPTSTGAIAGVFNWGPVNTPIQISNEEELVSMFGKPDNDTADYFMTASDFLSYSQNLLVTRVKTTAMNTANGLGDTSFLIENDDVFHATASTILDDAGAFCARFPGTIGNSISVSLCDGTAFSKTLTGTIATTASSAAIVGTSTLFLKELTVGSILTFTANSVDFVLSVVTITDDTHLTLSAAIPAGGGYTVSGITAIGKWQYASEFSYTPSETGTQELLNTSGQDELHLVVVDKNGVITGTAGTILEKYIGLSKGTGAKTSAGENNYYVDVINLRSIYVYATQVITDTNVGTDLLGATGSDPGVAVSSTAFKTMNRPATVNLTAGVADSTGFTNTSFLDAFDILANDEVYDFSLLMLGKANSTVANYAIASVAELRKDCVVFVSPEDVSDASKIIGNTDVEIGKLTAYKDQLNASSYYMADNGYKYMYDRYNSLYRWIPLNGSIAGCCARTDFVADAWFSPAGLNRGKIKNCSKLAVNPNKTQQATLYNKSVNFVINKIGEGFVLWGDKTGLIKPSAFDRINVRRLFIVLEKSIATAARFQLFENNTVYTRAQFKAMTEPFLRDIQGRQGITDFAVIVDETVNTPEVIASNTFKGKILIKPVYSINYIELSFAAVGPNVSFSEVAGIA